MTEPRVSDSELVAFCARGASNNLHEMWQTKLAFDLRDCRARLEAAERERDSWIETARQHANGMQMYRDLLDQCAAHLGREAWTSDDGSVQQDPVRLKIPELVGRLAADVKKLRAAIGPSHYYTDEATGEAMTWHPRGDAHSRSFECDVCRVLAETAPVESGETQGFEARSSAGRAAKPDPSTLAAHGKQVAGSSPAAHSPLSAGDAPHPLGAAFGRPPGASDQHATSGPVCVCDRSVAERTAELSGQLAALRAALAWALDHGAAPNWMEEDSWRDADNAKAVLADSCAAAAAHDAALLERGRVAGLEAAETLVMQYGGTGNQRAALVRRIRALAHGTETKP